jgi:hypothetical protein
MFVVNAFNVAEKMWSKYGTRIQKPLFEILVQIENEFVLTFEGAFHGGFNSGHNHNEAVTLLKTMIGSN